MSSVRPPSAEPDSDRPGKKPRLHDASPLFYLEVEPPPTVPADSAVVDVESGSADYARNPPTFGLQGANKARRELAPQMSQRKMNRAAAKARRTAARKLQPPDPWSTEWIIAHEVEKLLGKQVVDRAVAEKSEHDSPFDLEADVDTRILEVTVSQLSSTGDSLSIAPAPYRPWVIIAPHALPGEKIRARVYNNTRLSSYADLLEVIEPNSEWRDMSRVRCKYFGACGGCQYQMLSYEKQLELKREVAVRAYQNYSDLPPSIVPTVSSTISSPLQYNYRTKITPHFDAPRKDIRQSAVKPPINPSDPPEWLRIGFNRVGTRKVIDIEECPIATESINTALKPLRERIMHNIYNYTKGASLCLRDSLELNPLPLGSPSSSPKHSPRRSSSPRLVPLVAQQSRPPSPTPGHSGTAAVPEKHICVTDARETVRERVGDKYFEYQAGAFFQNNNSVLHPLTSYVRSVIFDRQAPLPPAGGSGPASPPSPSRRAPTHLIDAYCGSGLFAVTLAPRFYMVAGIEIAPEGVRAAVHNARLNRFRREQCTFLLGDAANIFETVQDFPRERTALIIDPPRKGTDERFIKQMVEFGCETVVYVSCNVHTQARDVGMIIKQSERHGVGPEKRHYVLESVRGFDLFPQTAHVESVAVLRLV